MPVKKVDISNSKLENRIFFETMDSLQFGETVEVIDDHDPSSLYRQLKEERPNEFEWNYLEEGPDTWKVSTEKKYLSFI